MADEELVGASPIVIGSVWQGENGYEDIAAAILKEDKSKFGRDACIGVKRGAFKKTWKCTSPNCTYHIGACKKKGYWKVTKVTNHTQHTSASILRKKPRSMKAISKVCSTVANMVPTQK